MIIDSIFWWIGCLFCIAGGFYFLAMFVGFFVDKIFMKMNAMEAFWQFLRWRDKQVPDNPSPPPTPPKKVKP